VSKKFRNITFDQRKLVAIVTVTATFVVIVLLTFLSQSPQFKNTSTATPENIIGETKVDSDQPKKSSDIEGKDSVKGKDTRHTTLNGTNQSRKESKQYETITTTKPDPKTQVVVLKIDTGSNNYSYDVSWQQDMTGYGVLERAGKENGFSFEAVWYEGIGSYYITQINGVGCCWTYTINGEGALGVSLENVEPDDVISWTHI